MQKQDFCWAFLFGLIEKFRVTAKKSKPAVDASDGLQNEQIVGLTYLA